MVLSRKSPRFRSRDGSKEVLPRSRRDALLHAAQELAAQLKLVYSGSAGAIMAEANAAQTVGEWERGLPALKLKTLLNQI